MAEKLADLELVDTAKVTCWKIGCNADGFRLCWQYAVLKVNRAQQHNTRSDGSNIRGPSSSSTSDPTTSELNCSVVTLPNLDRFCCNHCLQELVSSSDTHKLFISRRGKESLLPRVVWARA